MPTVLCYHSHTELWHEKKGDLRAYDRDFGKSRADYHCRARAELTDEPWTYVTCPDDDVFHSYRCKWCDYAEHAAHRDAIMISVDGACRDNGKPTARSAIGVFFHRNSELNRAMLVVNTKQHTRQRAELLAALRALQMAYEIRQQNPSAEQEGAYLAGSGPRRVLRRVVIRADSKYVVDAMTVWIFKWLKYGCRSPAPGGVVMNEDLFRRLNEAIERLEKVNVKVQFWHVPREHNSEADCLANAALDSVSARNALGCLPREE